jgi:putative toxin-antitoxin system antitoxin component (TIGR02293 family)
MLTHPTLDKLEAMRFTGMAGALREQLQQPEIDGLSFLERLGLLARREMTDREDRRLKSRLRRAGLRQQSAMEDLDYRSRRGLDRQIMQQLASCEWIRRRKGDQRLTAAESDRLWRLLHIFDLALEAFGEREEAARTWLTTPHPLLQGETPLERLDTEPGLREVEDMLTVIDETAAA